MEKSLEFYKKLGFEIVDGGHLRENFPDGENSSWRIMQCETAIIGLFKGMFPNTILTFNPEDVRGIQKQLKADGIELMKEADPSTTGPESIILMDPDGNQIMVDQHE